MATSTTSGASARGAIVQGAIIVAVGLAIGQVAAYLLSLVGARILGPADYSIFASMLALVLLGNVLALGLQAVVARRLTIALHSDQPRVAARAVRTGLIAGAVALVVALLLTPGLSWLLHLDSWLPVLLIAASLFPLTALGASIGIAQGYENAHKLAYTGALNGVGRAVGGIGALLITPTVTSALVGMMIGAWVAGLLGWLAVRSDAAGLPLRLDGLGREIGAATLALIGLFTLTNMDVLLARHFLSAEDAGIYAAGAVVAKVTFWLPYFVATVTYPRLSDHRREATLLLAAGAVVVIGVIATAGVYVLPSVVVSLVGGSAYAALASYAWLFAATGSVFALAQFLLYSQLAKKSRVAAVVPWIACAALAGIVWINHDGILAIILSVLSVAVSVCALGIIELVRELVAARRTSPTAQEPHELIDRVRPGNDPGPSA